MYYGLIGGISSTDPHYAEVKRRFEQNQKKQAVIPKPTKKSDPAVQARRKFNSLTAEQRDAVAERVADKMIALYNQRAYDWYHKRTRYRETR